MMIIINNTTYDRLLGVVCSHLRLPIHTLSWVIELTKRIKEIIIMKYIAYVYVYKQISQAVISSRWFILLVY